MIARVLNPLFYFGLSLLTIGTLFKIQHWPGGYEVQFMGLLACGVFFICVIAEILQSQKAATATKITCATAYLVLPIAGYLYISTLFLLFALFIAGSYYLRSLRKRFLFTQAEVLQKKFESI